jgi:L-iditol 2-dehydrogenase
MKALVLSNYKQFDYVEAPPPVPADDELLIRVAACGICGSDVHGYDGSTGRRLPPIIMGHEASGTVEETGKTASRFRPGDRVTFDSTVSCGKCFFCSRGQINLCDRREVIGVATPEFRRMGAFAEFVAVPERIAYHLPATMPFEHAALIEAASVAAHAVSLTPIARGDRVAVIGAGMIGLLTLQSVRYAGASEITVFDIDDTRLSMASALGATRTMNSRIATCVRELLENTDGRGVDTVLECVGTSATVNLAMDLVRKGGQVTLIGNVAPTIEINLQSIVTRQIRLQGSCASSGEYEQCIALMAEGAIQVAPLISAIAPLCDGAAWFARLYERVPGLLKVVLQP